MSRSTTTLALVLALAAGACEKGGDRGTEAAPSASAPLTDEAVDQARIPVKEDFEEEALKEINENNLEAEVAKLEQAIEADNP